MQAGHYVHAVQVSAPGMLHAFIIHLFDFAWS